MPAIGEVSSLPGLILAAGFGGHGFGIGPGSGHLVADIVTGQRQSLIRSPTDQTASLALRSEKFRISEWWKDQPMSEWPRLR